MTEYDLYKANASAQIKSLISNYQCQPILFVGAGLSRRYFEAPGWHEALKYCLSKIDDGGPDYQYYIQKYNSDAIQIGSLIAKRVHEWAWSGGKNYFPSAMFQSANDASTFLKHMIAERLIAITPNISKLEKNEYSSEVAALKKIRPHAVITTNYDTLLENLFEGYESIIGERVIKYNTYSFGEIYKIHGSVSDVSSMVLTSDDYKIFMDSKRYISAKLLTYFIEHPVFIFGYGFQDPNIQSIIEDVGSMISSKSGTIENIFYIKWDPDASKYPALQTEHLIGSPTQNFRVKAIITDDFHWIFESLALDGELKSVNTKLVRALAARAMKLIRSDIPKGKVEVNYDVLERVADSEMELPTLLGITDTSNSNLSHPFVLSQIAAELGYNYWSHADKLIKKVHKEKGINIKSTDNIYHCRVKTGKKSYSPKYSKIALDMLRKVKLGQPYECKI